MYFKNLVVAVKCDGKVLREQDDKIYIPYGKDYSILLKNLFSRKALVGIEIDGQDVLDGNKLIVDANSEVELERYLRDLDKGNKFKFVEFSKDIENYRGRNALEGIIKIEFQYERKYVPFQWNITYPQTPIYYPLIYEPSTIKPDYLYDSIVTCSSGIGSGSVTTSNVNNSPLRSMSMSSCTLDCANDNFNDTGITVPGSISDQKFKQGNIGELESNVNVITLQLKGIKEGYEVKQPLTVDSKIRCVTCGKINRSDHKFCMDCGTSLVII